MCGLASLVTTIGQEAGTCILLASVIWSRNRCVTQGGTWDLHCGMWDPLLRRAGSLVVAHVLSSCRAPA